MREGGGLPSRGRQQNFEQAGRSKRSWRNGTVETPGEVQATQVQRSDTGQVDIEGTGKLHGELARRIPKPRRVRQNDVAEGQASLAENEAAHGKSAMSALKEIDRREREYFGS